MDKKEQYKNYYGQAISMGYTVSWYNALVVFIIIFWMVIRSIAIAVDLYWFSVEPNLGIIIEILLMGIEIFLFIKIRQHMMSFSRKLIRYLFLFLGLDCLLLAVNIFYLAIIPQYMIIDDPSVITSIIFILVFDSLNALYFYRRHALLGNMQLPEEGEPAATVVATPAATPVSSSETKYYPSASATADDD